EQPLLVSREEPIAPLDGPAQRALPLGRVVRAGREQIEAATESVKDLSRCEHLHTRGSKLEREGKSVELLSDLTHRRIRLEPRLQLARAQREENRAVVEREHRHRKLLLGGNVHWALARGEDPRIEPDHDVGAAWEKLLEIVEHKQRLLAREKHVQIVGAANDPAGRWRPRRSAR